MKVAAVYYSRTGNTELVVKALRQRLLESGSVVDAYRVLPVTEYARPLHLNPRLLYDTLVRGGTDIRLEPNEPRLDDYDVVVVASPIWCYTLAPPVQEFLKRYRTSIKRLVVVATSTMGVGCTRVEGTVKKLCGLRPVLCVSITVATVRDSSRLRHVAQRLVNSILSIPASRS